MDHRSNPRLFQPFSGRKHLLNNSDVYHREQEQRNSQVQEQQRCHQEAVSQRADRFLSAQRARSDAVRTRLGLPLSPPDRRVVPHPPVLCTSPRYSERYNRTDKRVDWSDGSSLSSGMSVTPLSSLSSVNSSVQPALPALHESLWSSDKFKQRCKKTDCSDTSSFSSSASVTPLSSLSSVNSSVLPLLPGLRGSPRCTDKFKQRNKMDDCSDTSIFSSSSSVTPLSSLSSVKSSVLPPLPAPRGSPGSLDEFKQRNKKADCSCVSNFSSSASITPRSSLSSVDTHTPDELRSVYPITPEPPFPLCKSPRFSAKSTQSRFSICSSISITPLSSLSSVDTHTPDELRSVYPVTPSPVPTHPPVPPAPKKSRLPVLRKRLQSQSSRISASKDDPRCPRSQEPWVKLEIVGRALQPGQGDLLEECKAERVSKITVRAPAVVPAPPAVTPVKKYSSKTAHKAKERRLCPGLCRGL